MAKFGPSTLQAALQQGPARSVLKEVHISIRNLYLNYIEHSNGLKKTRIRKSWGSQKHWLNREIHILNDIRNFTISRKRRTDGFSDLGWLNPRWWRWGYGWRETLNGLMREISNQAKNRPAGILGTHNLDLPYNSRPKSPTW